MPGAYGLTTETVVGKLCLPASGRSSTIHLLISGWTLGSTYWDFPYQPDRYSYVRAMSAAGFATLDYDRVGIGASSHPASVLLHSESDAFVTHQLVHALRDGDLGSFRHIVLVGHSYGVAIAESEASVYEDVDGLILSDNLTSGQPDPAGTPTFAQAFYPAALDPKFAGKGLDPGYITVRPGFDGLSFAPADTDPAAITMNEKLKETVTEGEMATGFFNGTPWNHVGSDAVTGVDEPVLVVVGSRDPFNCDPSAGNCANSMVVRSAEQPYFPRARSFDVFVLRGAGHPINLERNARDWFRAAASWSARMLGR